MEKENVPNILYADYPVSSKNNDTMFVVFPSGVQTIFPTNNPPEVLTDPSTGLKYLINVTD